jgi:hypothetical protein
VLGLLRRWRHPFVLAHFRMARRGMVAGTLACVLAVPLAVGTIAGLRRVPGTGNPAGIGAVIFVCVFPLIMAAAAALGSAAAVLAETRGDTAAHVAMTGLDRRTLAAAKVLPSLLPPLAGMLVALPAYMWLGASPRLGAFLGDAGDLVLPAMAGLQPLRLVWLLPGMESQWDPSPGLAACGLGLTMWATDLGLVWAAGHRGAALALRHQRLDRVAAWLAISLGALGAAVLAVGVLLLPAVLLAAAVVGLVLITFATAEMLPGLALTIWAAVMLLGWAEVTLRAPVRDALEAFAWFDSVLGPDFRPPSPRAPATSWALYPPRPE